MIRNPVEVRLAVRDEMLADAPPGDLIWIFAYGSLIWNPAFDFDEQRVGTLYGYHRRFCFWSKVGRGSPDAPGMMLALDNGGACTGILLGVRRARAQEELTSVFMREMTSQTYFARWGKVKTDSGWLQAITFVANHGSENYVGRISLNDIAGHIARGFGHLGSCSEYLFNTMHHLEVFGLKDPMLRELCDLVEQEIQ